MSPDFWQLLLTAELPFVRREALLERARRLPADTDWVRFFKQAHELTPADRERVGKADPRLAQQALDAGAVILERHEFPERARTLEGVPSALFASGCVEALSRPGVGIVGTRGASPYGLAAARKFAESLALSGVTIVSGGAQGVDAEAHKGAMEAGGFTVCAMSCGIDKVYPAAHRKLFEKIRDKGCLISQFPAGWNPRSDSFVQRNATIAALSDAVLVVEAPERSGALITANRANEYGRPVFVVPGTISSLGFRGSHALIREGAILVDHPDQILEDLGLRPALKLQAEEADGEVRKSILRILSGDAVLPDSIAERAGLDPSEVLSELTMLELDGRVIRGPGGYILAP